MNEKERWETVMQDMAADDVTLSKKLSYTYEKSLTGLLFILARYKFCMKMMMNRKNLKIIDFGCNDGTGDLLIAQNADVKELIGVDFDGQAIKWANDHIANDKLKFVEADFLGKIFGDGNADFLVSLDVIEHIPKEKEKEFRDTIFDNLSDHGVAIIGTPNVTIYPYANEINKKAHINNYDQTRLYELFAERFHNVFVFGMNDESVNTSFYPFNCYIVIVACK